MIVSAVLFLFLLVPGEGLAQDRLNYTIECVSPNVVNVKWEVTQRKFTDDVYTVTAQYSCYNTASGEKVRSNELTRTHEQC